MAATSGASSPEAKPLRARLESGRREDRLQPRHRGASLPRCRPWLLYAGYIPVQHHVSAQDQRQVGPGRVDRNGGSYQDLAVASDAISPDWSERGIFYGGSGIQVTQDVSDTNENRVVLSEYRYQDPAVQPGGDRIVFHTLEKDHWEIFTANADGSNVAALDAPADHPDHAAAAQCRAGLEPGRSAHRVSEQPDRQVAALGHGRGRRQPTPFAGRRAYRVQLSGRAGRELGTVERKVFSMTRIGVNSARLRWGGVGLMLMASAIALVLGGCSAVGRSSNSDVRSAAAAAAPIPTPTPIIVSTPSDTLTSSQASAGGASTRRLDTASLTYNGEIIAKAIVPVVAQVAGQIEEVRVAVGDDVKRGDLLVRIDSTDPEAQWPRPRRRWSWPSPSWSWPRRSQKRPIWTRRRPR